MIIIRYLIWSIFKSQLAVLFVLLVIFFCQKLVKILDAIFNGEIPTNLVLSLLGLGIPEMTQFILPLSLFLGLLMTLGNLYINHEITAMYACGLGKAIMIKAAMILAVFTSIIAAMNVIWIGPWSLSYQNKILAEAKANPGIAALAHGQFQQIYDSNSILFIKNFDGNCYYGIFLAQLCPKNNIRPSIITANSGQVYRCKDGSQIVILNNGTRFEGTTKLNNFRITNFQKYQAMIKYQKVILDSGDIEQMNMLALWHENTSLARIELHWRITLIFTVLTMALMAVPLSKINPSQWRALSMLPAMLLYLVFFLLQTSIKSNAEKGKIDLMPWIWIVNILYLLLAVILNLLDTALTYRIRANLYTEKRCNAEV